MPIARRLALGAAAGLSLGYAAVRAAQALCDLGAPLAARATRDPRRYGAARRALMLASGVRGVASLAVTGFILADPLERAFAPLPRALRAPALALTLAGIDALREVGTSYVEEHQFERVWGTTNQSAASWFGDQVKSFAIGAGVTAVMVALGDVVTTRAPRRWPWVVVAATPPLLAFATIVAPTFIMPLFNEYKPITGELERSIRALAARYGAGGATILHFDMSRQTTKANAFVVGVLGTQRIALGDTLLDAFPADETLFVVAHELGHYVRRDPWTGIAIGTGLAGGILFGAHALLRAVTGRRLDSPAQGARLLFFANALQLALVPAVNALTRALERRADRFAVAATGDAQAGIRAFRRLGEQNLAEFDPPRWAQLLFASHPSLAERIRALELASG